MADRIFTFQLPKLPNDRGLESMGTKAAAVTLTALSEMARAEWIRLAQAQLVTSRRTYVNAIQRPQIKGMEATVTLAGAAANAIERGAPQYDMRTTLLGPNVPVVPAKSGMKGKHQSKKGGYWRAIPFDHTGPTSQGATGQPMGRPYHEAMGHVEAQALGRRIKREASKLAPTYENADRTMHWGGRLKAKDVPKLRAHHTTSIYTGMVKITKTYRNDKTGRHTNQHSYRSWRVISTDVMRGWIRRATPGVRLLDEVDKFMRREAKAYMKRVMDERSSAAPRVGP